MSDVRDRTDDGLEYPVRLNMGARKRDEKHQERQTNLFLYKQNRLTRVCTAVTAEQEVHVAFVMWSGVANRKETLCFIVHRHNKKSRAGKNKRNGEREPCGMELRKQESTGR